MRPNKVVAVCVAALNDSDSNDSDVESINGFATTEPVLSKRELPATPMEQTPPQLPPRPAEDAVADSDDDTPTMI